MAAVLGAALVVGALIGLASPSIRRKRFQHVLAEGRRGTGGRAVRFVRRALDRRAGRRVGGPPHRRGLMLTSFRNLLAVDAGFNSSGVITGDAVSAAVALRDQAAVAALFNRPLESIRAVPGVQAAGITSNIALSGSNSPSTVSAAD